MLVDKMKLLEERNGLLRGIEDIRRRLEAVDEELERLRTKTVAVPSTDSIKSLIIKALRNGRERNIDIARHVSDASGRFVSTSHISNTLRQLHGQGVVVSTRHRWYLADPNRQAD